MSTENTQQNITLTVENSTEISPDKSGENVSTKSTQQSSTEGSPSVAIVLSSVCFGIMILIVIAGVIFFIQRKNSNRYITL